MTNRLPALLAALTIVLPSTALAQQVTKQTVPGVTNFARRETTVACGRRMGSTPTLNALRASEMHARTERPGKKMHKKMHKPDHRLSGCGAKVRKQVDLWLLDVIEIAGHLRRKYGANPSSFFGQSSVSTQERE